jgi:hypothetical protein
MRFETIVSYLRNELAPIGTSMYTTLINYRKHSFNIDLARLSNIVPVPSDAVLLSAGQELRMGVDFPVDSEKTKSYNELVRQRVTDRETDPNDPIGGKIHNGRVRKSKGSSTSSNETVSSDGVNLNVVEKALPKRGLSEENNRQSI